MAKKKEKLLKLTSDLHTAVLDLMKESPLSIKGTV